MSNDFRGARRTVTVAVTLNNTADYRTTIGLYRMN